MRFAIVETRRLPIPLRPPLRADAVNGVMLTKIMRIHRRLRAAVEGFDVVRFDVGDFVAVLHASDDGEEAFVDDGEAVPLENLRGKDGVGDAGFVFEAKEGEAFRGAGALAADDGSGDADGGAIPGFLQITRAPDVGELIADERHGMRAGAHAGAAVVGGEALGRGHGGERGVFADWQRGEEIASG